MLAQMFTAIIRTLVPTVVGTVIAWLAAHGLDLGANEPLITTSLVAACTTGYYAVVSLLERKVNPAFGWLLGVAKAPTYDALSKVDPSSETGASAAVASDLPTGTPVQPPVEADFGDGGGPAPQPYAGDSKPSLTYGSDGYEDGTG